MKLRHLARQASLQVLVALLLEPENTPEQTIKFVHKEFAKHLPDDDFMQEIVVGVLDKREKLDKIITKFAPEWPVEKLDPVERCILELGLYELLYTDTPDPVVINEAVDLAKEFGDDTAGKFTNGVLSSVHKKRDHL